VINLRNIPTKHVGAVVRARPLADAQAYRQAGRGSLFSRQFSVLSPQLVDQTARLRSRLVIQFVGWVESAEADVTHREVGRPRQCPRYGFSLVELMIATVILGIGLVMVATIFPVAVDQTREAVQMSIVQAVADSAEQTLRLRMGAVTGTVPIDQDSSCLPGDRPHTSDTTEGTLVTGANQSSISQPTMPSNYDANPSNGDGNPATIYDWEKVPSQHPCCFRIIRACNMVHLPRDENNIEYLTPTAPNGSLYDPRTEMMLEGYVGGYVVPGVPSQFRNLLTPAVGVASPAYADANPKVSPHWIGLVVGGRAGTFPRIDLLDRVYPPVSPRLPHRPLANASSDGYPRHADLMEASTRRYCWVALGAPGLGSAGPEGRPYELRILVMYRGEMTARYASQSGGFGQTDRHTEPKPLTAVEDTLFPRPWLVRFHDGNTSTFPDANYTAAPVLIGGGTVLPAGTIICRREVAELLPPGAIFVDFERGRAHTVLQNVPDRTNPNNRRLILAPDPDLNSPIPDNIASGMDYWYPDFPDYAWVVPPPIVRTGRLSGDYFFEGKCPVLAVFESTIPR